MAYVNPSIVPTTLGVRWTGGWETGQRPKHPRQGLQYLYPNGRAQITAMLGMMPSEKPKDPEVSWWTENFPTRIVTLTDCYTDEALSSAATGAIASGSTIYAKMALADAKQFRVGQIVEFRTPVTAASGVGTNPLKNVAAIVDAVSYNGTSSFVKVRTMEASTDNYGIEACTTLAIIGSANAEGGEAPDAVNYNPSKLYTYCQIFRTPFEITGTMMETELYTGDALKSDKKLKYELHGVDIENAVIFGRRSESTGPNGKPIRTMMGILEMINTYAPGNVWNYYDTTGGAWTSGGLDWFEEALEQYFRWAPQDVIGWGGSGALLAIQRMARTAAHMTLTATQAEFGIKVVEWTTPFGTIKLRMHPLLTLSDSHRNSIILVPPNHMKERPLRATKSRVVYGGSNSDEGPIDGMKHEWLTETCVEYQHPHTFGLLTGLGVTAPSA